MEKNAKIIVVACNTATTNLASLRLAEKCGFTREGVLRGLVFVAGAYLDDAVFSILRSEWEQRRSTAN